MCLIFRNFLLLVLPIASDYFIHIDELGRVSFYYTRAEALEGEASKALKLVHLDMPTVVQADGTGNYSNATWTCAVEKNNFSYIGANIWEPTTGRSICEYEPYYEDWPGEKPEPDALDYENSDISPRSEKQQSPYFELVCSLKNWELQLNAPEVDTTSVSEKFGSAVKSVVSGGGSAEFFIDKDVFDEDHTNGLTLLQMLLMTDSGYKAKAKFHMLSRPKTDTRGYKDPHPAGDLFYESEVLITQTAVNVRPEELVVGTAQFVTTGRIALKESILRNDVLSSD